MLCRRSPCAPRRGAARPSPTLRFHWWLRGGALRHHQVLRKTLATFWAVWWWKLKSGGDCDLWAMLRPRGLPPPGAILICRHPRGCVRAATRAPAMRRARPGAWLAGQPGRFGGRKPCAGARREPLRSPSGRPLPPVAIAFSALFDRGDPGRCAGRTAVFSRMSALVRWSHFDSLCLGTLGTHFGSRLPRMRL